MHGELGIDWVHAHFRTRTMHHCTKVEHPCCCFKMPHALVADALDELSGTGAEQPNIGEVGSALGIDPSLAGRMVAGAVQAGYVKRLASQVDGRSTNLELTNAGRQLLQTVRRFRTDFFSKLMAGWSDRDCREFARLLTKFTEPLPRMRSKYRTLMTIGTAENSS